MGFILNLKIRLNKIMVQWTMMSLKLTIVNLFWRKINYKGPSALAFKVHSKAIQKLGSSIPPQFILPSCPWARHFTYLALNFCRTTIGMYGVVVVVCLVVVSEEVDAVVRVPHFHSSAPGQPWLQRNGSFPRNVY